MTVQLFGFKGNVSASAVISSKAACKLKKIIINSGAATAVIQLFDDTTTSSPQNPITGPWTVPAGGIGNPVEIDLDIVCTKGLTILITVAAANVTLIGNF